jgi:hypothetical protein
MKTDQISELTHSVLLHCLKDRIDNLIGFLRVVPNKSLADSYLLQGLAALIGHELTNSVNPSGCTDLAEEFLDEARRLEFARKEAMEREGVDMSEMWITLASHLARRSRMIRENVTSCQNLELGSAVWFHDQPPSNRLVEGIVVGPRLLSTLGIQVHGSGIFHVDVDLIHLESEAWRLCSICQRAD